MDINQKKRNPISIKYIKQTHQKRFIIGYRIFFPFFFRFNDLFFQWNSNLNQPEYFKTKQKKNNQRQ